MDPLPPVNKAYNMIQQVEKQKQITYYNVKPIAFYSSHTNNNNGKKHFRKSNDPYQRRFYDSVKVKSHL